jgi:iron complex transport system ATP-binding protein
MSDGLRAQGIVVRRGGRTILDNVSAAALPGAFTAVIGPNGAGKSTLISVLAGLLKPDAGTVALDGVPLPRIPMRTLARRRAYLPQNARCEWPISVERVVALGLTPLLPAFGDLPREDKERVAAALAQCDLTQLSEQPVTTLSGGELGRAMLARALVGDPEILMVDEPTAGLDPRHALDAMRRLRALADAGRMVIAAVHDLALALPFAHRIIALQAGRVVADGPVDWAVTPALLKALYDVEARIGRDDDGLTIRFLSGAA